MLHRLTLGGMRRVGLAPYLNLRLPAEICGTRMRIPILDGMGRDNLDPAREWWLDRHYRAILAASPQAVVLDVGANVGQTLLRIKALSPNQAYVGFEPNPFCCFYLNQLISANDFSNCRIVPVGLGEEPEIVPLYKSSSTDPAASTVKNFRPSEHYTAEVPVAVFDGDRALKALGISSVCLIKVDVEGGELEALRGLRGCSKITALSSFVRSCRFMTQATYRSFEKEAPGRPRSAGLPGWVSRVPG